MHDLVYSAEIATAAASEDVALKRSQRLEE